MRSRLTYVPIDVADQFSDFIIQRHEQVLDAVKARTRDYSTLSLLKLLYQLRNNSITFSDLYKKKIKSIMGHMAMCLLANILFF